MRTTFYGPCGNFLFEWNLTTKHWQARIASHQVFLIHYPDGVADGRHWLTVLLWHNPFHYRHYSWWTWKRFLTVWYRGSIAQSEAA